MLTDGQKKIVNQISTLFKRFKVVMLKGDIGVGKHMIANEFFNSNNINYGKFDISEICIKEKIVDSRIISNYLTSIYDNLKEEKIKYIYIRRIDQLNDFFSDYQSLYKHINKISWIKWFEEHDDVKILLTTVNLCYYDYNDIWTLEMKLSTSDTIEILKNQGISDDHIEEILKFGKSNDPSKILQSCNYSRCYEEDKFLDNYKLAMEKLIPSSVDVENKVIKPVLQEDLVGLEDIIEEIKRDIIFPIQCGLPDIDSIPGLILSGPPGTGKSSIGRWISHQLKGKFFEISGSSGTAKQLITEFEETLFIASENTPSVIFIDDVDHMFENPDTLRGFLTLLNGLYDKESKGICVIVTCMNSKNIPSEIKRGGRLESLIQFKLPNKELIEKLINNGISLIEKILNSIIEDKSLIIKKVSGLMIGLNCADIRKCNRDVLRKIVYYKNLKVEEYYIESINGIREQYSQCATKYLPDFSDEYTYYT